MRSDLTEAARKLLAAIEEDQRSSTAPTVGELYPIYWETEAKHLRSAQRTQDAWNAICNIVGSDGIKLRDRRASAITSEIAEEIRTTLKQKTTRFRRPPRPATINRHLVMLRRLLNWAVEQRRLEFNPLKLTLAPENNIMRTAIRSEEEFNRLLDCCDQMNRALCLLYFDGGLRRMEGINLQRHQVLRIPGGSAWLTIFETKSGQARWVPITNRALEALDALPDSGDYYFANPDTKVPFAKRYLYEKFKIAVAKSGLKPAPGESFTWHCLRHSFVYVRRAIDHIAESTIMAFTGHSTRSAFSRYGITDPAEMAGAIASVEQRLAGKRIGPKVAAPDLELIVKKRNGGAG